MKRNLWIPGIFLLNILVWAAGLAVSGGNFETVPAARVVGEIFSTTAISLISFSLVLAVRSKRLERLFGGLDRMYILHCKSAYTAVLCILLHVLLVWNDGGPLAGKLLGAVAAVIILAGIAVAIVPVFNRYINFERWGREHKLVGLFFIIAAAHAVMMNGVVGFVPFAYYFASAVAIVGFCVWVYSCFIHPFTVRKTVYTVSEISYRGPGLVEVRMCPKNEKIVFKPGQFAWFTFAGYRPHEEHPFVICSGPDDEEAVIRFSEFCDYTVDMYDKLAVGTEAYLEGPFGQFVQDNVKEDSQIWFADGAGISPFVSMAENLGSRKVHLYWTVKHMDIADSVPELPILAAKNPNFIMSVKVAPEGELTLPEEVVKESGNDTAFLICCPGNCRRRLIAQLKEKNVKRSRIHVERFTFG